MNRLGWLVAVAFGSIVVSAAAEAAPRRIHYDITPETISGALTGLRVRLDLSVRPGSAVVLDLPDQLRPHLAPSGFTVTGGQWTGDTEGEHLTLKAATAHVTVTYRLQSDGGKRLTADDQDMGIHASWFALRGDQGLLTPENSDRVAATVEITPLKGWTIASSLNGPAPLATVGDSQFVGGTDYRLLSRTIDGAVFRLAYPDSMASQAAPLLDDAATIVTAERRFWGTPPKPVFIGLNESSDSAEVSGRGLQGGFSLYLGNAADRKVWRRLIAHENLHQWISRAIGGFPAKDSDLETWLNEGFTEAYTARLLLASGLWTTQDYLADWNESLARYGTSPVKTAPNSRILADRNRDFYVNRLPYDRGRLLAVIWDRAFRARTQSRIGLAEVVRAQMVEAARNAQSGQAVSADRLFPVATRRLTGIDLSGDLARYVDRGEALSLTDGMFGPCVTVESVTQPVFDRGFDFNATLRTHGRLTGLEAGGPADKAGLKEGDKLRIDEIPTNDSRATLSYRVDDGNGRSHTVSYRPEGKETVTFQQLALKPGADEGCLVAVP
jgi:predicted metalloprotease with PDZ domain